MSAPRVLYLVTEPWYFANHRLDHARALLADGFDVHVATRSGERWDELVAAGCVVHEIDLARGSGSVRGWLSELRAVRRLVRSVRPDVVHAVALKPVAVALSLLASWRRPALILSVNGLGITAADGGRRMVVIRTVIRVASRLPRVLLLFQTRADQRAVVGGERGVVIPGVGVDTDRFVPGDRPVPPPTVVVYLGRAVASKGLLDLADALDVGPVPGVELHLYCAIDESSPGALSTEDVERLRRTPGMTLHEPTQEPQAVLGRAHAAILPSRAGEGVSKFVLEALACGAPVLLSAESGSGEVIEPGRTGLVFTAGDTDSIRGVLGELAEWSPERRAEMVAECRAAAEEQFALDVILPKIVDLHRSAAGVST
jgi:glycosyltransferase involved in cell wall biosynthesis